MAFGVQRLNLKLQSRRKGRIDASWQHSTPDKIEACHQGRRSVLWHHRNLAIKTLTDVVLTNILI